MSRDHPVSERSETEPIRTRKGYMRYQYQTARMIVLVLLSTVSCAGPSTRRDVESPPTPKMPTKLGASLDIPWEKEFVTMESVWIRDTIYVAAQLSWDEQGMVKGETVEAQMRQAYANVKKLLERHGAKLTDVVEETIYVIDMKATLAVAQKVRHEVLGEDPIVASSLVEVRRLGDPKAQVAIKVTAKLDMPRGSGQRGDDTEQPARGGRSRGGRGMGGRGMGGGGYGGPSPY